MANVKEIDEQLKSLELEEKQLQLELMRENVRKIKQQKENAAVQQASIEHAVEESRRLEKQRQAACNHHQGGIGLEGYTGKGHDSKYAVNKHTYPDGKTVVMCNRCLKEWRPGDPGYAEALTWQTDNTPSSSVTFNIPAKA